MTTLSLLVLDPDEAFRAALTKSVDARLAVTFHSPRWPASVVLAAAGHDVVLIGVDSALGLQAVADLCSRPNAPPVIAIGRKGFDARSLEHILTLAEVRGAAATMMKPADTAEIAAVAYGLRQRREAARRLPKSA